MYIQKQVKVFDTNNPNCEIKTDIEKIKKMLKGVPIVTNDLRTEHTGKGKVNVIGTVQSNIKECHGVYFANVILLTDEFKDSKFVNYEIMWDEDRKDVTEINAIQFK